MPVIISSTPENKEIEKNVDEDINRFGKWFVEQGKNEPLCRSEIAILKTYLYYKLKVEKQ